MLAFVALWPAPGIAEGVLVLGALAMLIKLVIARFHGGTRLLTSQAWALTSVLFFAYWLPQLFSTLDAVDVGHALYKTATGLRYLPFLWLVAAAVATAHGRRITFTGLAVIVGIWTLDGLAEAAVGTSPLFAGLDALKQALQGEPMCTAAELQLADRLGGVLGPCNLKLGLVLASLSPFALWVAGRRFGLLGWVLAMLAMGAVIVLAGSRASWITYALVVALSGWKLLGWRKLVVIFAIAVAAAGALTLYSPQLQQRVDKTTQIFNDDDMGLDTALAGRGRIWNAAVCMIREHPINGVGARGFRDAFPGCDPENGKPAAWGDGPAFHAHQLLLEVLSETGVLGLLLWLLGAVTAWRAWRYASAAGRERARPAMWALVATAFPLNTHLAFYSTFWGGLFLMLAALYAGSLWAHEADEKGVDSE